MVARTTVGFLYPGYAAEDDYPWMAAALAPSVALPVVHTSVGEDAHRLDALLDLGGADRLAEGVPALRRAGVQAVVWACTSGSFVFGWDGAREQVDALARLAGVPATSTPFAFVRAARALGVRRVAVAATYPEDIATSFVDFLAAGGITVVGLSSRGIITAAEVGTLGRDEVLRLACANDHPDAEAVLLHETALNTVAWLDELEAGVGKPVLTANQVSVWDGLRIAGHTESYAGVGALFRAPHNARGV
ncbi:aspartate/glutamate racemase family protein [soil metagenome]